MVDLKLKFTPVEFETKDKDLLTRAFFELKFTPLEFETRRAIGCDDADSAVKIYSVGV